MIVHLVTATVVPSRIFSSNMVLQRQKPVKIWGTASPGEAVMVSFNGQTVNGTAAGDGSWSVILQAMEPSSIGRTLTIQASNTITDTNVVIGDVWL